MSKDTKEAASRSPILQSCCVTSELAVAWQLLKQLGRIGKVKTQFTLAFRVGSVEALPAEIRAGLNA